MHDALKGVRVVDLTHVVAGPMTTHMLATLGAEVIKIEPPAQGDALRHTQHSAQTNGQVPPAFAALNQRKRSCALDIRDARSRAHLLRLIQGSDVVVENFRPGVLSRFELDYASVTRIHPNIVYCSVSGYGQTSQWRNRPAYDHILQAAAGMMMINGQEGEGPIKTGFPLIDTATAMLAAFSISAALIRRARDGMGAHLDISMIQSAMHMMLPTAATTMTSGQNPQRNGNAGWMGSPGADTFACADGFIAVAANTYAQVIALAHTLGLESAANAVSSLAGAHPHQFMRRDDMPELYAQFKQECTRQSAHALEIKLNVAGVPASRVRTVIDVMREASTEGFGGLAMHPIRGANGSAFAPGLTLSADQTPPHETHYPAHGQHTRSILQNLGVSDTEIDTLIGLGLAHCSQTHTENRVSA